MSTETEEEIYQLTPLGFLESEYGRGRGAAIFEALEEYAKKLAGDNAIAAIVFDSEDGSFVSVQAK